MTMQPSLTWNPFPPDNALGDPGRQPEIKSASSPLNVGVSDTALDFLTLDAFEVRGCSTRGWSHRYKGTPRQDDFALLVNDDVVVVAVADGVSEGDFSQVAAETAARSACKLAADQIARNGGIDWVQLAGRISMRIIEEGEYRKISQLNTAEPTIDERLAACLSKMSTTLIVAVIDRTPRHDGFPAEIGVVAGDSAAYLLRLDSKDLEPVGGGKVGTDSITSTAVRPLPGPVKSSSVRVVLQPGDALIVGSDGIGDPVGDGTGEVGQEFARRWAEPPPIDRFLLDVNVYRRSFDDDRTAVGVWVRPEIELPPEPVAADPTVSEPASTTGETLEPASNDEGPGQPAVPAPVPAADTTRGLKRPTSHEASPGDDAGGTAVDAPDDEATPPGEPETRGPLVVGDAGPSPRAGGTPGAPSGAPESGDADGPLRDPQVSPTPSGHEQADAGAPDPTSSDLTKEN